MKKLIISLISIIAIIYLIGEKEITPTVLILDGLSLAWLWIVAKANNYFYQGE